MKWLREFMYYDKPMLRMLLNWSYIAVFIIAYVAIAAHSGTEETYGPRTDYQALILTLIAFLAPIGCIQMMCAAAKLLKGFSLRSNFVERSIVSVVIGVVTIVGIWRWLNFQFGIITGLVMFCVIIALTDFLSQKYDRPRYETLENPVQYFVAAAVALIVDIIAMVALLINYEDVGMPPHADVLVSWVTPAGYITFLALGFVGLWSTYVAVLNMWGSRTEFFMTHVTPPTRYSISLTTGAIIGILVYWFDYSVWAGILTGIVVGASLAMSTHEKWQRQLGSLL